MENENIEIKQLEVVMTMDEVYKLMDVLEDDFIISIEVAKAGDRNE